MFSPHTFMGFLIISLERILRIMVLHILQKFYIFYKSFTYFKLSCVCQISVETYEKRI